MPVHDEELPLGKIAASSYRAFVAACQGLGIEAMPENANAWFRVADVLAANDGSFTVQELGEHVRQLYLACCGEPADDITAPSGDSSVLAWQAVGLHLFNLIQGAEDNLRMLEASWASWVREKLSPAEGNKG